MGAGNITPEAILREAEEPTLIEAIRSRVRRGYRFRPFYHPYVAAFVHELNKNGVDGLLQRDLQLRPDEFMPSAPSSSGASAKKHKPLDFEDAYWPTPPHVSEPIVGKPYPEEEVCFDDDDPYASYNWEVFVHAPWLISNRLFLNEQHEESDRWRKCIYNSTDTSTLAAPQRFWQTKPFYERADENYERQRIESLLTVLAKAAKSEQDLDVDEKEDLRQFRRTIAAWAKDPFKPHLVARLRTTAYQKAVVMQSWDNRIAWADKLYRLDTIEHINLAAQIYVSVGEEHGRLAQHVPARARPKTHTYNTLEPALDELGNALVEIEEFVSPSEAPPPAVGAPAVTTMFYFCVPKNDKLLGYWDVVADRLFKIRHCMNIEGVVRQLPLFEPPIDPALLVKATAAGVDIGSVLADVNAPLPHYPFPVLMPKAAALGGELKGLGAAMLEAVEKRDGEKLSLLRAQHETGLLALVKQVRGQQIDEAAQSLAALRGSRAVAVGRWQHYQRLLGVQSPAVPTEGEEIQEVQPSPLVQMKDQDGVKMIPSEIEELHQLEEAQEDNERASWFEITANVLHGTPNLAVATKPYGCGTEVWHGGTALGLAASAFASRYRYDSSEASYMAGLAAKTAQYALRGHDHTLQANQAAREIMQIDKQIIAAEIRHEIAKKELSNHEQQLANAAQVEAELKNKYTNQELYGWKLGQLASVFFQTYQLAYDFSRGVERCWRHDLGVKDSSFIKFGYWDSLKKGLLAGERLMHDLTRMEVAYLDKNKREFELTKHVSLLQLDPLALVALRETGSCAVNVPEALFDLDYPGHYMRRIKSVRVSIPCVTGPYTGVSCVLSLLKSSVRHADTLLGGKTYARVEEDPRFTDNLGIESIATSSGQMDSGLHDPSNQKDARRLPFEGRGVISEWRIDLPAPLPQFEYATIANVIVQIDYTSRPSGGLLAQQAANELHATLNELVSSERATGLAQFFSLRHEFPDQWNRFLNPGQAELQRMTLALEQDRFPFWLKARKLLLNEAGLFLKVKKAFKATHDESTLRLVFQVGDAALTAEQASEAEALPVSAWNGMLRAQAQPAEPLGVFSLTGWRDDAGTIDRIDPEAVEDIILVCRYTINA